LSKPVSSNWYCCRTNPRCEERAKSALGRAGFGVYLPVGKIERQHRRTKVWSERTLLLMPGYLFIEMPFSGPDWFTLRRCDGVKSVLGAIDYRGESVPMAIPSRQIEKLIAAQANLEFDDTRVAKLHRQEIGKNEHDTSLMRYPMGSRIIATEGPFATFTGLVTGITARGDVEAMIELMGRLVPVEFPTAQIEAVDFYSRAA